MAGPSYGYVPQPHMGGKPTSGLAIAGLITGIIPFTCLLGVILSFIAVFLTGPQSAKKGRGLAISGVIVGLLWTAGWGWGGYQMFTFGKLFVDEVPAVLMYGMEIRAEKYHAEKGEYPQKLEDFWSDDCFDLAKGNEAEMQGGKVGMGEMKRMVFFEATPSGSKPYRIYGAGYDGIVGTSDDKQHVNGVNPLLNLERRLREHPFVNDEAAAEIVKFVENYYRRLRELPLEAAEIPTPAGTQ